MITSFFFFFDFEFKTCGNVGHHFSDAFVVRIFFYHVHSYTCSPAKIPKCVEAPCSTASVQHEKLIG